jgi:hypothetical protein
MFPFKGYYTLPLDPSLKLWFEADKVNNVNTALPSNGANISSWYDISGLGAIPTKSTAANQPVFTTNVANGNPAITFNSDGGGANGDSVTTNTSSILSSLDMSTVADGFTVFVCAQIDNLTPPSTSSGCLFFIQGSSPNSNEQVQVSQTSSGQINSSTVTSAGVQRSGTAGNAVVNTPFINSFWWDKANTTIAAQFNSNSIVTISSAVSGLNANPTLLAIGQQKASQPTRQFDGKIFCILLYSRYLSSEERTIVKQYLGTKYGVSV